jgi:membrane protein
LPISNARRNWSYILGVIGVVQLLMGFMFTPKHLFIGAFFIAWAWFTCRARKGQKKTWKTIIKTIILILSSVVFLASVNAPYNWEPIVIQALFLIIILALRGVFSRIQINPKTSCSNDVDAHIMYVEKRTHPELSKRTKRLIYWIGGIILFITILPFIILAIDKAVDGYMHYYYSVQSIGQNEEVDSCVITDDVPISDIIYYPSDGNVEVYPVEDYYNTLDSAAE